MIFNCYETVPSLICKLLYRTSSVRAVRSPGCADALNEHCSLRGKKRKSKKQHYCKHCKRNPSHKTSFVYGIWVSISIDSVNAVSPADMICTLSCSVPVESFGIISIVNESVFCDETARVS